MKIRIMNLIPQSIESLKKTDMKVRYAGKNVGVIKQFIYTKNGIDAIANITNKKLISKLQNQLHPIKTDMLESPTIEIKEIE